MQRKSEIQWIRATDCESKPGDPDDCGSNACVEVAFLGDTVAVRDSKNPKTAPLIFTKAEWTTFIGGVKDGEFDCK